jgi:DNA-directed RNA polymerase subunit M/transcription elongation factor TFIIS
MDSFFTKKFCDRCGKILEIRTMSMFNQDVICMECKDKESAHPKYEEARKRDLQEIKNGNRNFEGIGKPEDL